MAKYKRVPIEDLWSGDIIYVQKRSCVIQESRPAFVINVLPDYGNRPTKEWDGRSYLIEFKTIGGGPEDYRTLRARNSVLAIQKPVVRPQPNFSVE